MSRWRDVQQMLAREMDWEAARAAMRAISQEYGGRSFYVPQLPRVDRTAVRADIQAGATQRTVAQTHGISVRTVRRIVRGA